jgi:predicted  nucleic acid-binding Zn-ribbon protein
VSWGCVECGLEYACSVEWSVLGACLECGMEDV